MSSPGTMLIVGATGLAGSHTRAAAIESGFRVVGAARNPLGDDLACDLLDPASLDQAVSAAAPDLVLNLAGIASVSYSLANEAETLDVNATGVVNLLDSVARLAPDAYVLCVSSGEVYGAVPEEELPAREELPSRPNSPYAASKVAMEAVCERYRETGMPIGVARAFNHTGPGQSDSFAASSFARQIAAAETQGEGSVTLRTGDLSPVRDFSDVRDVARAYVALAAGRVEATVNVCSGNPTRLADMVGRLASASRVAVETSVDPDRVRPGETPVLYGSPRRLREATGWEPRITLDDTLADLLGWWRERMAP